jgi:hypothetical protein
MFLNLTVFMASILLGQLLFQARTHPLQPAGPFASDNPPMDWREDNQTQNVNNALDRVFP